MNQVYLDSARLLTRVAPLVLVDDTFALARIPAKWNHFAEKDSRQNQYVGANPYRQSLQLWRDLL